jgi:hypothetical protein
MVFKYPSYDIHYIRGLELIETYWDHVQATKQLKRSSKSLAYALWEGLVQVKDPD